MSLDNRIDRVLAPFCGGSKLSRKYYELVSCTSVKPDDAGR
jgi:hypothetical protein